MEFSPPFDRLGDTEDNLRSLIEDPERAMLLLRDWLIAVSGVVQQIASKRDSSLSLVELEYPSRLLKQWADASGLCESGAIAEARSQAAEFREKLLVRNVGYEASLPACKRFWEANGVIASVYREFLSSPDRSTATQFHQLSTEVETALVAVQAAINLTHNLDPVRRALGRSDVDAAQLLAERDESVRGHLKWWTQELVPRIDRMRHFEKFILSASPPSKPCRWRDHCATTWHGLSASVHAHAISELRWWYQQDGLFPDVLTSIERFAPQLVASIVQERATVLSAAHGNRSRQTVEGVQMMDAALHLSDGDEEA
ncbi:MAG: hypothetical protein KF861_19705, partial [Planctomycetaceae bacterium]|nr:hypothetical protein [Planctomycetaceae bacterium]